MSQVIRTMSTEHSEAALTTVTTEVAGERLVAFGMFFDADEFQRDASAQVVEAADCRELAEVFNRLADKLEREQQSGIGEIDL